MKLERHVGGLSLARKERYLRARGWTNQDGLWRSERHGDHPLKRAVHHQLTEDLVEALRHEGWQVLGYSPRGYAQLRDGATGPSCSVPKALRIQARREGRPVAELTYSLFLAALRQEDGPAESDDLPGR
jgi:hypothetical protein